MAQRRWLMAGAEAAAALMLAAGCTAGEAAPSQAQCPVSDEQCRDQGETHAATAMPMAQGERVLAVITATGGLQLYGIGPQRPVAHLLRVLTGPAGAQALGVTLSGASSPRVCATWDKDSASRLRCYDERSPHGQGVQTGGADLTGAVGLSSTGQGLAWAAREPDNSGQALFVQRTEGGSTIRLPAYPSAQDADEAPLFVGDVSCSGDDTVLVSHTYDDDVNGSITQISLKAPPRGWTTAPLVDAAPQEWPVVLGAASSTRDGVVLAVLHGFSDSGQDTWEAAALNLRTKKLDSVISTPAKGGWSKSAAGRAKCSTALREIPTPAPTGARQAWRTARQ